MGIAVAFGLNLSHTVSMSKQDQIKELGEQKRERLNARPFRKPLAKDADKTISRQKPWVAAGMSRASWYRQQAEKRSK